MEEAPFHKLCGLAAHCPGHSVYSPVN